MKDATKCLLQQFVEEVIIQVDDKCIYKQKAYRKGKRNNKVKGLTSIIVDSSKPYYQGDDEWAEEEEN